MPKTVGVAVSNATFHFDKLYTYAVMPDQQDTVRLGSMVLVPFGRGSRARMGVVLACDAEPESAKLKFLFDVAPASACLTPELLRLVHFFEGAHLLHLLRGRQGGHSLRRAVQAHRGGGRRDPGASKAARPPHGKCLQAGGHAASKAQADRQAAGRSGPAGRG